MAVGRWGIQPSEFWHMTPEEWFLIYDANMGEPKYGNLLESEVEELYGMLH